MLALKITQVGNSLGLVLPKEAASRLKVEKGDVVYLTEAADGYRITPYDPGFEEQMDKARAIMKRRRNALRELAK
jgi:putative addiction module antidote